MPSLSIEAMPTEIADALTALMQSVLRLHEQDALELAILRQIAAAIDSLTAWLQTPPSSELSDALRDLVTRVDALTVKIDGIEARLDRLIFERN